jgi:GNAT superfamily N-acetyltransferase
MPVVRTAEEAEAARLIKAGGRLLRVSREMVLDLTTVRPSPPVPIPEGLSMVAIDRPPAEVAQAAARATPPGHVDHEIWKGFDRPAYWRQLLAGEVSGPLVPAASGLLVDSDGSIGAAVVVTILGPLPDWWSGGPWIPEIFVVPSLQGRGIGTHLLAFAARTCRESGRERLGLTVTDANPAKRLYERFGFRLVRTHWTVST